MNPKEFVHNTAYSVQLPYITDYFQLWVLYKSDLRISTE